MKFNDQNLTRLKLVYSLGVRALPYKPWVVLSSHVGSVGNIQNFKARVLIKFNNWNLTRLELVNSLCVSALVYKHL